MAGVAGDHRAAARLRHVADQNAGPAGILFRLVRQPLYQRDHVGMGPVAIARQPHHLPGIAIDRQSLGARDAAMGIEAEHLRRQRRRQYLAAEQFLGADPGIVGVGNRRQRFGIDAALVLRPGRGGSGEADRNQQRNQNQAGCHRITLSAQNVAWNPQGRTSAAIAIA